MSDRPSEKPGSDVYTVLVLVASIFVIGCTVVLAMKNQELFGTWNPFA